MARILVVEDELGIADAVLYALRADGMVAEHCLRGEPALARLREEAFDVAILDVGLPDLDGFALCRRLRAFSDIPVIFLTARDGEIDRVLGLELGADDYVVKPFSPRELVARVRARLRRVHPIQYTLVGLALAIFFLLLLSLSEHMAFWIAYLLSSAACIGLLGAYLSAVLRSRSRGIGFAAILTALYAALYGLLVSEDNALVLGSLLLFAILAAAMLVTRRIDWYSAAAGGEPEPALGA